jgi:hypothetical protein
MNIACTTIGAVHSVAYAFIIHYTYLIIIYLFQPVFYSYYNAIMV